MTDDDRPNADALAFIEATCDAERRWAWNSIRQIGPELWPAVAAMMDRYHQEQTAAELALAEVK